MTKTEFSVSIQAQSPACFVWLVAKDVRGRFSENGFLLTEPSKSVCSCVTMGVSILHSVDAMRLLNFSHMN